MTRIAFIGFGEAAQAMAGGLRGESAVIGLSAYDVRFTDAAFRETAQQKGVSAHETLAAALEHADIVLSLVVGSAAVAVGQEAGKHLAPGQIFIDLNSISPDAKERVRDALGPNGARLFVEGAVMARVPPLKHKVPILLAGPEAQRAESLLGPCGMDIETVGTEIGQACAVKMIRSVIVKGVEALLLESLTAAEKAGVRERILDSITGTFPGIDWRQTATYYIGRTHQHGARRVTEMKEAATTIESLGLDPVLSRAIAETIRTSHERLKASELPFDSEYPALLATLAGMPNSDAKDDVA